MIAVVLEAILGFVLAVITKAGYAGIFVLMFLGSANIPIPSEVVMPFSGFLVQRGVFEFWLAVFIGATGDLLGSLISYNIAGFIRKNNLIENHRFLRIIFRPRDIEIAEKWFAKYGAVSVFFGRMVPVVRTFISFPAGIAKMNLRKFSILTFSGSLIWSTILAWFGFSLGENWAEVRLYFEKFDYLVILAIVVLLIWWVRSHFYRKRKQF